MRVQVGLSQSRPSNADRETRFQLGQAIGCGEHAGSELGALRICASARAVVAAKERADAELGQALAALDKTAAIVRRMRYV